MRNLKILFVMIVFTSLIFRVFAFDTSFYFSPEFGTKIKLYCDTPVYMMINWWSEIFNWFQTSISFDSNNITIKTWHIHPEFLNGNNYISWNFYNVWWAMVGWYKQWLLTWVSFSIVTKTNIVGTTLSFVDKNWNAPSFWLDTTDDNISLDSPNYNWDILSSVNSVTYNFVALPCIPDWDKPEIVNVSVNNWANKISTDETIRFTTYDWNGSTSAKVSHWFSGNSVNDLSHYVVAPNNVDNQEWVNKNSISVKVSCPTCAGSPSNTDATLSISNWNWDDTKNALTWDSERRWYNVSFNPPFPYEIEKKVTVNISVTDNQNENWQTHTRVISFSFNTPVNPTITRIYPSIDTFVSPSKNFPISFYISDDWAGIDTWSIVISIPQIMSGDEILFSWYIYSWSDLDFELISWSAWLWNAWSYKVSFYPKEDFPVNTEISMNVEWSDLAWTSKTITSKFTTRPNCDFFWCVDSINIIWSDINQVFSGIALVVTWTNPNSPYPYLTWENNEILMCGVVWDWITFGWTSQIYDTEWNLVWWNSYTDSELFITGLNFVYEDWKIFIQ